MSIVGDNAQTPADALTMPGGVSKIDYNRWKEAHGIIHAISVIVVPGEKKGDAPKDVAVGYIRDASNDLELFTNVVNLQSEGKRFDAKVFLLNNAWLGGDKRMLTVPKIQIAAASMAGTTVDMLDGTVEKL